MDSLFRDKVTNSPSTFHWLENNLLWYVNNTAEGKEYLRVDPIKKTQAKCFDHTALAKLLSEEFDKDVDSKNMEISALEFDADLSELKFIFDKAKVSYRPNDNKLTVIEENIEDRDRNRGYWGSRFDEKGNPPVVSPDSTMTAFIKNNNLYIKDNKTEEETQLSYDGAPGFFIPPTSNGLPMAKRLWRTRCVRETTVKFTLWNPAQKINSSPS